MFPTPEQIEGYIKQGITCTHIQVEGDGQHFYATIVSPDFEGKRLVQRHQLVYGNGRSDESRSTCFIN